MRDHRPERRTILTGLLGLTFTGVVSQQGWAAEDTPQRIMIFGDSQAQGLVGGALRLYRSDRGRKVLDKSKISTGLMPRANYDWPEQARGLAAGEHADVAVALYGANDRPPVRVRGHVDSDLVAKFTDSYGARVADISRSFREAGVPLVWVGHPIVKESVFAEDMALLNEIYAERSVAEGAIFLSTWDTFKGSDGQFSAYGRGCDGQTTRLRTDDGVHMSPAGYDVITAMLMPYYDHYRRGAQPQAVVRGPAQG